MDIRGATAATAGRERSSARHHDCGGGGRRKRYGGFLAAKEIGVAVAPRLHRDVCGVGAATWFGDAECSDDLAAADRRKELGLLARVAAARNYRADEC